MARTVEPLLGTRAEVSVSAATPHAADEAEQSVLAEATRLETIFTVFDTASPLHQFRRTGHTTVPELQETLELATAWQRWSGGAFNASVQPLVDVWDSAERAQRYPTNRQLEAAIAEAAESFTSHLNLNAIAKGWIAQRALVQGLAATGSAGGWLSLGGDIVHRGPGSVVVGIEDPARPYDNVAPRATIELANEALATSGGARRWWLIDGHRYSKVLDPRSGHPVHRVASSTVVSPDGATADVLATLGTVLTPDETFELAAQHDSECMLILADGTTRTSSGRFRPS